MNIFFPQDFYQNVKTFFEDWGSGVMYSRIKKVEYASARKRILVDGETKEFWIGHYKINNDNSFSLVESVWCTSEKFDEIWDKFYRRGKTFKEIYENNKQSQDENSLINTYYYSPTENTGLVN